MNTKRIIGFVSGFLFSIFLTLLVTTILFSRITDYENAKTIFMIIYTKMLANETGSQQINEIYGGISIYCREMQNITISLPGEDMNLNCSEILAANSTQFPTLIAEKYFDTFYFKDYGCDFLKCIQGIKSVEDATFVLSSTSHDFSTRFFYRFFLQLS